MEQLNTVLTQLNSLVMERYLECEDSASASAVGFTLADLADLGQASRAKVLVNCMVKLKRAALHTSLEGDGTKYVLQ